MASRQMLPIELRAVLMDEWVARNLLAIRERIMAGEVPLGDAKAPDGQARFLTRPPETPEEERLSHSTTATPRASKTQKGGRSAVNRSTALEN